MTNNTERAIDALYCIPPDLSREDWVKVAMGAHAAGVDFDTFNSWSAQADNYEPADARDVWKSIKPGKGIGAGTLYRMAAEHGGWRMNSQPKAAPVLPPFVMKSMAAKPAPGIGADEVYNRFQPATPDHPYIKSKSAEGVPLDGLRVVPEGDPLRILGESMAGALVLPVTRPDGTLSSLQFIAPPATAERLKAQKRTTKPNLPGASLEGWLTVGKSEPGGVVYVCEGIGAAWACWKATGKPAVVAFGWGRVKTVAEGLKNEDPDARLVLVPDVGKEAEAKRIAAAVGAMVACMPEGWEQNADVHDLAERDGADALAELLDAAESFEPPKPAAHPLLCEVVIDLTPRPPRWVLPGLVAEGVALFAGWRGVGKTTALLPMAMCAAGIHEQGYELSPEHWRHVVYATEDTAQALRVIAGMAHHLGLSPDILRERVHLVEAKRLPPSQLVIAGAALRERYSRTVKGVDLLPLVVLDTQAATIELESENDNAEASRAIASIKQDFAGLPVWLVAHVAKTAATAKDSREITTRGAGAFEADAHQTLYLVQDNDTRLLLTGKTRFEPRWHELTLEPYTLATSAANDFGTVEPLTLRWSIARPSDKAARLEQAAASKEESRKSEEAQLRQDIRDVVQIAWQQGHPLSRSSVAAKVGRNKSAVADCTERLLAERWLIEIEVPSRERLNAKKARFLVNLDTSEHEALMRGEPVPASKEAIPASWKKAFPFVPDVLEQTEPEELPKAA